MPGSEPGILLYEEGMEVLMPEGPEIETDKLHEAIQEEMEKEGGNFLKRIALSTAILRRLCGDRRP